LRKKGYFVLLKSSEQVWLILGIKIPADCLRCHPPRLTVMADSGFKVDEAPMPYRTSGSR